MRDQLAAVPYTIYHMVCVVRGRLGGCTTGFGLTIPKRYRKGLSDHGSLFDIYRIIKKKMYYFDREQRQPGLT